MTETYDYAGPYKTLEAAQAALEDCYATGEVCEGERPRIEARNRLTRLHPEIKSISVISGAHKHCYWITLTYA